LSALLCRKSALRQVKAYCGGEEIPRDRPKAFAIFKKESGGNDSFGDLGVGAMYQMGWGVEQDLAEAFNSYRKAAVNKNYSSVQGDFVPTDNPNKN
jgi:uncharacterized protein